MSPPCSVLYSNTVEKIAKHYFGTFVYKPLSHGCNVLLANRDQPSTAYADVQSTGVATFTLVDAENDRTIQEIREGDIINADVFATHPLTIRAAVEGPVGSVHLALTES